MLDLKDIEALENVDVFEFRDEVREEGKGIYLGDLKRTSKRDGECLLVPDLLMGSRLSGGSLTRSNHDVFLEDFGDQPGVFGVYGGHGTYGVAIRLDSLTEEMWEVLRALSDDPVIDEEKMSEMETEAETAAWNDWAASDFRRALADILATELERRGDDLPGEEGFDDLAADAVDSFPDEDLSELFRDALQVMGEGWSHEEGGRAWVDVKKMAKAVDIGPLLRIVFKGLDLADPLPEPDPRQMPLPGVKERRHRR